MPRAPKLAVMLSPDQCAWLQRFAETTKYGWRYALPNVRRWNQILAALRAGKPIADARITLCSECDRPFGLLAKGDIEIHRVSKRNKRWCGGGNMPPRCATPAPKDGAK